MQKYTLCKASLDLRLNGFLLLRKLDLYKLYLSYITVFNQCANLLCFLRVSLSRYFIQGTIFSGLKSVSDCCKSCRMFAARWVTLHKYVDSFIVYNWICGQVYSVWRWNGCRITRGVPALGPRPWVSHGRGCGQQGLSINLPDSALYQPGTQFSYHPLAQVHISATTPWLRYTVQLPPPPGLRYTFQLPPPGSGTQFSYHPLA